MVTAQSVSEQLARLHFNQQAWGRAEVRELQNILLPDEEIYELVNGIYEGGFALLVTTNVRLLLIDKKPLNYLTVEDLRFDMINEIDYSHRLIGAKISISAGAKNLVFRSYNQPRLRKAISHLQRCMAEAKQKATEHQVGQSQHLERINQQLQTYLLAQHRQQDELRRQLEEARQTGDINLIPPEPVRPDPELADYLFAQSLLRSHDLVDELTYKPAPIISQPPKPVAPPVISQNPPVEELYEDGMEEIFGKRNSKLGAISQPVKNLEINPLTIAYSKLPMAMRNRRFRAQPKPVPN